MFQARLLGQFEILLDGRMVEIPSRPAQSLLAYLILNANRPHRREKLAGMFWPDTSEANARSSLRHALWRIRKAMHPLGDAYLEAGDLTITYKPQPGDWLDIALLNVPWDDQNASGLFVEISQHWGELLPGFYEEWVILERERLQALFERKMGDRIGELLAARRWHEVLAWGERWIAFGQTPEPAYRALMLAHAQLGDMASAMAVYQRCVEQLYSALGVKPSAQTQQLLDQIQAGTLSPDARHLTEPIPAPLPLPAFLQGDLLHPARNLENPGGVFVARESQMAALNRFLSKALDGEGQVALVCGEAGMGKSALLQAFTRQAVAAQPTLIAVSGTCNAFSTQGDPYLPFRTALSMLTGEVETHWEAGAISMENARRLWAVVPLAVNILLDRTPGLLNTFVSAPALRSRAAAAITGEQALQARLQAVAAQGLNATLIEEQAQLFEQFAQYLQALARQHPILITIDDLQWADNGSLNLLFHLSRRLAGSRILILGAYRSDEVDLGRGAERHPLEPLIYQLQRAYGDLILDLNQVETAEARHFVEAYLDSEANGLDETFRTALFQLTQGQPLFTIELLRSLQERGELYRNEQGCWVAGKSLDWALLPARVEGVIQERVSRLDKDLREILSLASVEGEQFTVQVLMRVQGLAERVLLQKLSQDLEKRHHLVHELYEDRLGEQRFSRFTFTHALLQKYLYSRLGARQRSLIHREIAETLEDLYRDNLPAATVALAYHYTQAQEREKAVDYLLLAGDQARLIFAHQEAITSYQQALVFLKEMQAYERAARVLMKLGLAYHNAFEFERAQQAYEEGNALWQQSSMAGPDGSLPRAPHSLRLAEFADPKNLDPAFGFSTRSVVVAQQLFLGLVEWTPELDIVPAVAQRWDILENGRKYVFHLRQDVFWSDGVQLTAQDFDFAWKRVLDPSNASPSASMLFDVQGARDFHQGKLQDPEQVGVRALDDFTLLVELEAPASYFPNILGHPVSFAVPRHAVERFGETWWTMDHLVCSGPFLLESWDPERLMVFRRNPRYTGLFTGNIEQVEWNVSVDIEERIRRYEANELDSFFVEYNSRGIQASVNRHAGEFISYPPLGTGYLIFKANQSPFDDRRIRRALIMAVDRESVIKKVLQGHGSPATGGFVPPGMPGHSAGIGLPYDPQAARQLMAAAGYPNGDGFPDIRLITENAYLDPLLEFFQAQWQENLGIRMSWEKASIDKLLDCWNNNSYQMLFGVWAADYPDPSTFLQTSLTGTEISWGHKAYKENLDKARYISNQEQRMKLYARADQILVEEGLLMPIFYVQVTRLIKPWVRRFPWAPIASYWKDVIVEPH